MIARLLLQDGKAKIFHRELFTIKLTYQSKEYTQPHTLGIEPLSGILGAFAPNNVSAHWSAGFHSSSNRIIVDKHRSCRS
ncbi:MAG: RRXRR domain-containing protein [Desulfovibrionaceae bacterium]|nr:RRXRR domain-containing protein [Desulfovibrionaceae bacterium]